MTLKVSIRFKTPRQLVMKTEFINQFHSINHLNIELFDYVNRYNNVRPHGALNNLTPKEYKEIFYKNCPI
ncbi:transposase [Macrococcus equipercicus]|uniref:Transposase n=1 Tax=Macrococcus equipercicus TaxID=69967 RepID=A0ABQ6RAP3_9STAP|nr:transposase [Macrococcus equipercicus]